jgi:SnoaL-like domain
VSRPDPEAAVAAFVDAFNAEDLDAFEGVISPTVEIQTRRGLVCGRDEAREWATRTPSGELHQRLVLEGVRADGHPPVALVRREWFWERGRKVALEEELGVLVTLDRDGLIAHWQPFADRDEALRMAGIG